MRIIRGASGWRTLLAELEAADALDWSRAVVDGSHVRALKGGCELALGNPLQRIGPNPRQIRSTALFALATELTAAMLGVHIAVAVQWQQAGSGDWTTCPADVSRRRSDHQPDNEEHPRRIES